jgi:competence protein ComEA
MAREPRAMLFLLVLAVAGHGLRLVLTPGPTAPGELFAGTSAPPLDPARQHLRAEQAARPLRQGERIDLNTASAEEIARLPRVGMSLAKRIVADRLARGVFRGLSDVDRVPGVGPSLLRTIQERVSFSPSGPGSGAPSVGGANSRAPGTYGESLASEKASPVELNSATEADLLTLPGIGPARARAILAYRRENGPFAAVSDLGRVPGISHTLVVRLTPFLLVR